MASEIHKILESIAKKTKELAEAQKITSEQIRQTDEQMKRTDVRLNSLNKKWEGFFGNYGEAVEEIFYRSLEEKMKLGDIVFDKIDRRVSTNNHSTEFDILLFNGDCVGIIEVKSKAHPKEVRSTINKKLQHFKIDYPQYAKHKIFFGIATLVTNPTLIKMAKEEGIFLLTQKGDCLEVVNGDVKAV